MAQLPSHKAQTSASGVYLSRQYLRNVGNYSMGARNKRKNVIYPSGDIRIKMEDIEGDPRLVGVTQEDLDTIQNEENPAQRVNLIRRMTFPLQSKKVLRSKLHLDDVRHMSGCTAFCYKRKVGWHRFKIGCKEFSAKLELWRKSFKTIEGHYGSAVASYFVFLKWLFFLNLYLFILMFVFTTIPQIAFVAQGYDSSVIGNTSDSRVNLSAVCTSIYNSLLVVDTGDIPQLIIDFLQGTGWMESTLLFEGFYSDKQLGIGTFSGDNYSYNMPLAYILVFVICLAISLLLMVRHTAKGLKSSVIESQDTKYQYSNIVFGGWDYSMYDPKSSTLKHKVLYNEVKGMLADERHERDKQARNCCKKLCLYSLRVVINLVVLGVLGGAGYLIYYATEQSTQFTQRSDYSTINTFLKLLMEYVPSITITVLNIIIPLVFMVIVLAEDYKPAFALKITLARTVFLRLASLAVIIGTLYTQIQCTPKDECNVGMADCPVLRCWETYVGQQIYKLTIFDFITTIAIILLIEFPRTLMVHCCKCKLAQVIGKPEFDIPKNVLDLVYTQTLCWLGLFFSPLIPGISVLKFFIFFYMKKLTTLVNYVPSSRPFRASKSHIFFMVVLLFSFVLCCIPIGFVIWKLSPSLGCGPFRVHSSMYEIITITINGWPTVIQTIFSLIFSAGFAVPAFVVMITLIYYYHSATAANREMVRMLKEQLILEGRDKQFLLRRINDLGGNGNPGQKPTHSSINDIKHIS